MTDMWDKDNEVTFGHESPAQPEETSVESAASAEEAAPMEETAPAEQTPVEEPVSQPAPQPPTPPTQPPLNGWSSDGSYRYVPPRPAQPVTPPTPPAGGQPYGGQTPPTYGGYTPYPNNGSYGWPQQPAPQPAPGAPVPPYGGKPPKKKNGWVVLVALLGAVAVVASLVLVVYAALGAVPMTDDPTSSTVEKDDSSKVEAPSLEISQWDDDDGGLSNKEIVNRNFDATVVLTVYTQSQNFNFGESSLEEAGGASGIIMTKDGYIITNWHCVINENTGNPFDRIDVTTYDGKTYEDAKVIGSDESTDLAVIKINASGLTTAAFGDSSKLSVGDRVVALGNAAGLSWTATFGYVSALARDVYDDTGYAIKCLQVDAAINYGNSGGPLLNNQGLVVGINSAKIAATGYEGLGFSIPINEAKKVIDSLLKNGYVKGRVALGITGQTVSSGMYNGFLIATIEKGSCLEGTKAQVGDLIVGVDDKTVTDYGTLRSELSKHKVGDKITLRLLRSDRYTGQVSSLTVTVTLKEQSVK